MRGASSLNVKSNGSKQWVSANMRNLPRSNWRSPSCAQATCELYVLLLDSDALGVNGAEIRIVEKVDEKSLGGFLEGHDGLTLPSIGPVFGCDGLGDFAHLSERQYEVVAVEPYATRSASYKSLKW